MGASFLFCYLVHGKNLRFANDQMREVLGRALRGLWRVLGTPTAGVFLHSSTSHREEDVGYVFDTTYVNASLGLGSRSGVPQCMLLLRYTKAASCWDACPSSSILFLRTP